VKADNLALARKLLHVAPPAPSPNLLRPIGSAMHIIEVQGR
jgi:hypothetical protein